jgi:5-methyltetrahydrofolate--homocysteine methyltransferase
MSTSETKGAVTTPQGTVPFGSGQPTLCVNDQCGYLIEREDVQQELLQEDFSSLIRLAEDGKKKGLTIFNVQLMAPALMEEERRLFPKVVKTIYEETGCGIAVDTKDPEVLDAALSIYPYKALCNCINGERKSLDTMLPIIAEHGGAAGTALVDEEGIPDTLERRLEVGRRIVSAAEHYGIPREDTILDAVCFPSGAVPDSMRLTLRTLRAFKEELNVPTLLGSSNAGFMMPYPLLIDSVYFIAAVPWGLDVAMISPYTPNIEWHREIIDFLTGIDPYATRYLALYRRSQQEQQKPQD